MLRFESITNIEEAKHWWNVFVIQKNLYDNWDFRYIFYKYLNNEILFYIGYDGEMPVGLFPLQKNLEKDWLEFFGGKYMENNQVYVKIGFEEYRREFYKFITSKANLEYIIGADSSTKNLTILDEKYFLPLTGLQTLEDYFQKYFTAETRGKMRRKIRHIEATSLKIFKNNFEEIENLFQFNIENFKDTSTFHLSGRKESFREILQLSFPIYLLSFYINGTLEGVSLAVVGEDGTYEYLNLGVRSSAPKDLRSYIHLKNIEQALQHQAKIFNAGCSDCGWKELFHLEKIPQYKFTYPEEAPLLGSV